MKIINSKNIIPMICIIFTATTLSKVIIEAIVMGIFGHYPLNIITILLFSVFSTLILSQHYRIFHLPLFLAVLIQYLLVVSSMLFVVWFGGHFAELAVTAYKDIFISTSFAYAVISVIYYIYFYANLKKHNLMLQKIRQIKNR